MVLLNFISNDDVKKAAQFVAGLAREGVAFECHRKDNCLVVTFTGGF